MWLRIDGEATHSTPARRDGGVSEVRSSEEEEDGQASKASVDGPAECGQVRADFY